MNTINHGCGIALVSSRCTTPDVGWVKQIIGEDPRVLLIQRGGGAPTFPGAWALPAGLLEAGETPQQAAMREAQEEIGVTVKLHRCTAPFWEGEWKGRKLSYFLAPWAAPKRGIRIQLSEVIGFGWFSEADLAGLELAFRYREALTALFQHLRKCEGL